MSAFQVVIAVKNSPANEGDASDAGSIPGLGRSSRVGNGNPLQYFCVENLGQRSLAGYSLQGCAEPDTTKAT